MALDGWELDGWGLSCYRHDFHEISLDLDTTLSAAKGKTWWLSEQPGGYVWHDSSGNGGRSPDQIRSLTLFALGKGAKGALFWQWRPELFGQESPYYGLTTVAGQPTPRSEAVSEIGAMFQRRRELFEQLIPSLPEIGLIVDLDTLTFEKSAAMQDVWFAGGNTATAWSDHAFGTYRALLDRGYTVRILDAAEVAGVGVPGTLRVLLLPLQIIERPGLIERLGAWVHSGGTLVAGPLCGLYGSDTFANRTQPPAKVRALFGITQDGDTQFGVSPTIELISSEALSISGGLLPGQNLLQPLRPNAGTEPIGVCGNSVALTAAPQGLGLSVMIGSLVGGQYDRVERPGLASLLDAICRRAGVVPAARATGGALVQHASSGSKELLFVHNPLTKGLDTWISLAESKGGPIRDLLTETVVANASVGRPFCLSLNPQDSRVLLIGTDS